MSAEIDTRHTWTKVCRSACRSARHTRESAHGPTDCLAPASALRAIDVAPIGDAAYEHADGSVHRYPFGLVEVEILGEVTAGRVLFGPDGIEPLVGVTALASIGFTVDPASQTLQRLPAIPLK